MKFPVLALITQPLQVGDVIHSKEPYLSHHYYKVIAREGNETSLHSCDERGNLTQAIKTFTLRDRQIIGSQRWQKVGFSFLPPRN